MPWNPNRFLLSYHHSLKLPKTGFRIFPGYPVCKYHHDKPYGGLEQVYSGSIAVIRVYQAFTVYIGREYVCCFIIERIVHQDDFFGAQA